MSNPVRPKGLSDDDPTIISAPRVVPVSSGSIVADSATLSDAHYPLVNDMVNGGQIDCRRLRSLWLGVEMQDGTPIPNATSITVEPIFLDRLAPTDAHWKRMLDAGASPLSLVIDNSGFKNLLVYGRTLFLRVSVVTGSITGNISILAFAGDFFSA